VADRRSPSRDRDRGDRGEVTIEKIVAGGFGLARVGGDHEVVLVPRVASGERVAVEIDRARRPARGRLLAVLDASPHRVRARCVVVDKCGGCDLMHLDVEAQRAAREAIVREALPSSMRDLSIEHHVATPERGRTRARWHAKSVGAEVKLGYRAASSTTIVDVTESGCPILDARLEAALVDARALLANAKGEGEVHASLGHDDKPVLSIEWDGELPPATFAEAEKRVKNGRISGVELTLRGVSAPATIGDARPVSKASDGLPLIAPPRGFAQASEAGDRVLVDLVVHRANANGARVVELFAGSGNLTVALAKDASHMTAIEIVEPACRALRANVEARSLLAKVKIVNADADATTLPACDVVVLDPPRAGAQGATLAIVDRKPKRIVYVSCDPATLGRDLTTLLDARYVVTSIDLVDLFPETSHVETIVTLAKAQKK
jgi:23S rRNA (uracil1939-C5)-methyltransferase